MYDTTLTVTCKCGQVNRRFPNFGHTTIDYCCCCGEKLINMRDFFNLVCAMLKALVANWFGKIFLGKRIKVVDVETPKIKFHMEL